MMRGFAGKRRAEEFDSLLSSAAGREDAVAQHADLLEVVAALRSVPEVEARPEFVSDLRSRLVVEAARQARPIDADIAARLTPSQRRGAGERKIAVALGGFAFVAATGSMAVASQSALPGDVLYPVKRAIENAEVNVQSDDAARAETLLAQADRRLGEVEALSARNDADDAEEVAATLQDFTEQTNQATELAIEDYEATGDAESVDELRAFTARSMDRLASLGDVVPGEARPALIAAAQTVRQVDSAAVQLCPTCGDGAITRLPDYTFGALAPVNELLRPVATPDAEVIRGLPRIREAAEDQARIHERTELRRGGEGTGVTGGTGQPEPDVLPDPGAVEQPEPDVEEPRNAVDRLRDRIRDELQIDGQTRQSDDLGELAGNILEGVGGIVRGLLRP